MLSDAEEQEMQLARGGGGGDGDGGGGGEHYPFSEEPEPLSAGIDILHDPHDSRRRSRSSGYNREIHLNHHDPMLDVGIMHPADPMMARYSPHDPVIGSLGSHDPMIAGPHPRQSTHESLPQNNIDPSAQGQHQGHTQDLLIPTLHPPMYQQVHVPYRSNFDFSLMESFAAEQRQLRSPTFGIGGAAPNGNGMGAEIRRRLAQNGIVAKEGNDDGPGLRFPQKHQDPMDADLIGNGDGIAVIGGGGGDGPDLGDPISPNPDLDSRFSQKRQRKLSHSNPNPRRQAKLAMFEGGGGLGSSSQPSALPHSTSFGGNLFGGTSYGNRPIGPHRSATADSGHDRPYRFSFYSNAMSQTIHARSLSELPAEGQTFEDLFLGRTGSSDGGGPGSAGNGTGGPGGSAGASVVDTAQTTPTANRTPRPGTPASAPGPGADSSKLKDGLLGKATTRSNIFSGGANGAANGAGPTGPPGPGDVNDDPERSTWWLDVLSPTDEEMRMLSKVCALFLANNYK